MRSSGLRAGAGWVAGWLMSAAAAAAGAAELPSPRLEPHPTRAESAPLRIGVVEDAHLAGPTQDVLREAYRRAGQRRIEFLPLPLRRSTLMLRQGELDGDFMRTQAFFDAQPMLLRVKVPLRTLVFWALSRPPCARAVSTETLAGARVAYQIGTVLVEAQLPASALRAAATQGDVLQRLHTGQADYALLPMTPGMVEAVDRRHPGLCRAHLPWQTVELYHALAAHQARLLPALEAALDSMRLDGTLARLWARGEPLLAAWRPTAPRPQPRNPER